MAHAGVHATLTADTVAEATFDDNVTSVEVVHRAGTGDIFFTVDGTDPAVDGDCYVVPAGGRTRIKSGAVTETVKLISTGTPAYSVQANV